MLVLSSVLVLAQGYKMEISTIKESFSPGENITFKISLYNSENKPVNANISVVIEDSEKTRMIEKIFPSNKLVDVSLGENARYGYWKITAKYNNIETNKLFMVEINELAKFSLDNDVLTITNTGNARYTKDVQIVIGDTIGVKKLDLDVGEKVSFRLIAPDGVYGVRVSDGATTLTKNDVTLTGKAVGILDEGLKEGGGGITGVLNPEDESVGKGKGIFVYVFLIVIIGALILLTLERIYKKKLEK